MKTVTNNFKAELKKMGRQQTIEITYTANNESIELDNENIISVSRSYDGSILKSVMVGLNIESMVAIPKDTEINFRYGLLVNGSYEYINYGKFIVYEVNKKEDARSYEIKCYDKMLYAMKDYEELTIAYPCTVQEYVTALAVSLGYSIELNNFANLSRTIPADLYKGLGYTYRDVLDEIAEALGCTIYIRDTALPTLVLGRPNYTGYTINEDNLKDINVNFGEKFGKINSIVLSRAGESDNVYYKDDESIEENGLCEIKIVDNQIMNFNDRANFLPGIASELFNIEYYLNDYSSTGVMILDLLDYYNVQIGDTLYKCLLLNDEQDITQGLEELIYTERPETGETDYTKADKTDQRINQTYVIVDKQNQTISSVVNNVTEQNTKIAVVEQTVNEINQKISDIADITTSQETLTGRLTFTDINQSEPINVTIHPLGENISYLYPFNLIYPANDLYIKLRTLRFTNTTTYQQTTDTFFRAGKQYYRYDSENDEYILLVEGTNYDVGDTYAEYTIYDPLPVVNIINIEDCYQHEIFDYELPDDLLYYDSTHYDELVLDYDTQTVYVNKQCAFNFTTGQVDLLSTPRTDTYTFPSIPLTDGDYTVEMLKYDNTLYTCYLFVRLMTQNIYTSQFYTKVETDTLIQQTSTSILNQVTANYTTKGETQQIQASLELKIDKTDNNQIISMINASADVINLNAGRLVINSGNFQLDNLGNITCTSGTIGGFTISSTYLANGTTTLAGANNSVYLGINGISCGNSFKVENDGVVTIYGGQDTSQPTITNYKLKFIEDETYNRQSGIAPRFFRFNNDYSTIVGAVGTQSKADSRTAYLNVVSTENNGGVWITSLSGLYAEVLLTSPNGSTRTQIRDTGIITPTVTQTSREENKKNFEKLDNKKALEIILNTDIYKYNLKEEKDNDKKHLGFVIGDKYNYSNEITSINEQREEIGVDNYSMTSATYGAIQELYQEIQELKEKVG